MSSSSVFVQGAYLCSPICMLGPALCKLDVGGTVREVASLCIFQCRTSRHVDEKQSSLSIVLLPATAGTQRPLHYTGTFSILIDPRSIDSAIVGFNSANTFINSTDFSSLSSNFYLKLSLTPKILTCYTIQVRKILQNFQ